MADSNACPCKGCTAETGRSAGCHAECVKYAGWDNTRKEAKKELNKVIALQRLQRSDLRYRIEHSRRVVHQHRV